MKFEAAKYAQISYFTALSLARADVYEINYDDQDCERLFAREGREKRTNKTTKKTHT